MRLLIGCFDTLDVYIKSVFVSVSVSVFVSVSLSRLMHRDITSPLFFSTSQTWRFWCGFCCSKTCCSSMACVAVDHSFIDVHNPISGHRFTFSFNTITTCSTHSTPIHPLPTNEQTLIPAQTTRSRETSLHDPKKHPQTIKQQLRQHTH